MYTAYQWEAYTHVHITHRKLLFRENKRQLPRLLPTTTQRQSERVSFEMQISMAIWYRSTCAPYSPCLTITDRPPPPLSLLGPIVPIVPRFRLAIEDRQHSNKSYNWHPSDNGQKNPERLGQVAHQHSLKRLDSLPCNAHLYLHNPRFPFLGLIDLQIGAHQKKSDRKGPEDLLFHPLPIHFEQHFLLSFFPITFVCCSGRFVVCLFKRGIELATPFP